MTNTPAKSYFIPNLPPPFEFETVPVLKALAKANRALAELKGAAKAIPNQAILINTLSLQEAMASSEIENIVTTQDELYRADLFPDSPSSPAAKEVALYRDALRLGFESVRTNRGIIANSTIIDMFRLLKRRDDVYRVLPGTELRNDRTGETVYVPPQGFKVIEAQMAALEAFINDDDACPLDPLIKMAIVHHQFESIHPFPDGNGRIGRILNVLYLTRTGLLDTPILYLSRYITSTKGDYYRLLQDVRDQDAWEAWTLYMLKAVAETAETTLQLVEGLRDLMADYKLRIRRDLKKIYSQDLLNNLFRHPYTRIEYIMRDLDVSRPTATKYLELLTASHLVTKHSAGRNNYYINTPLVALFMRTTSSRQSAKT
ncbi:Fic family protein [Hyphomonas sp.]|uniref:Fic family protein n=1 Tax=Hyphomonas sp. TaxID=87 RepID=UPI00391C60E8